MQHTLLVTGGAGFIGSNFVQHILSVQPDIAVVVLDKLTYAGNLENLDTVQADPRFSFIQGDICDVETVRAAMKGCDWVVHFAAETHVDRSILHPGSFVHTDVEGTLTLLEIAREYGVSRFVQISTDEVYGNAESPDGLSRPSLETDAIKPLSPYAASKAGADRLAFSYWATYGMPVVITRCSNNYGPYQYPEKQLPLFISNAMAHRPIPIYGDGKNTRDWIYVRDHTAALIKILYAPSEHIAGEVFNIGANEERSILENAQTILTTLGKSEDLLTFVPDRLGHVRRHAVNSAKLQRVLGWTPSVRFEEGIAETISWYQKNTSWLEHVLAKKDLFLENALQLGIKH